MRIDTVYLKDVGPFREVKLDIQPCSSAGKADLHIFVGPNGSGKSTLLYAMAAVVGGPWDQLGTEHGPRRFRSKDARAALRQDGETLMLAGVPPAEQVQQDPRDPFEGQSKLLHFQQRDDLRWYGNRGPWKFWHSLMQLPSRGPTRNEFDFAAFAYAGTRSLSEYNLVAIQEPEAGPFTQALSFDRTVAIDRLSQWLSSTFARRALARETNDPVAVARYSAAIERIEAAVRQVIGGTVTLRMSYEPLQIVVDRDGTTTGIDLLPDGLKSILSWVADLLMRLERIPWKDDTPLLERSFALFLDEIDVHLHPAWQRRILPMVQGLFPGAQIFVTTHSPFVVSSVSDAWVYPLRIDGQGSASADPPVPSQAGTSFATVLRSLFGIDERFDDATEEALDAFYNTRNRVLSGEAALFEDLSRAAYTLGERSVELRNIVMPELFQVAKRLGREP